MVSPKSIPISQMRKLWPKRLQICPKSHSWQVSELRESEANMAFYEKGSWGQECSLWSGQKSQPSEYKPWTQASSRGIDPTKVNRSQKGVQSNIERKPSPSWEVKEGFGVFFFFFFKFSFSFNVLSYFSSVQLCDPVNCSPPGSCPGMPGSPRMNTGVGCHLLLTQ